MKKTILLLLLLVFVIPMQAQQVNGEAAFSIKTASTPTEQHGIARNASSTIQRLSNVNQQATVVFNVTQMLPSGDCTSTGNNENCDSTILQYTVTVNNPPILAPGNKYYLRSNVGNPWGQTTNQQAMDAALGVGNWTEVFFETVDVGAVFSPATNFVYIDGSDFLASELNTFLQANLGAIESWVSAGGNLLLNSAPNEGGNINFGFGGTTLNYTNFAGTVQVQPGHPVLLGPFLPTSQSMSGNFWAHASITGTDLTTIANDPGDGDIHVAEKPFGNGHVVFGGMTTTNFHTPPTEAFNFRANLIAYLEGLTAPPLACTTLVEQPTAFPGAPDNAYSLWDNGAGITRSVMDDFVVPGGPDQNLEEVSIVFTRSATPFVMPPSMWIQVRNDAGGTPGAVVSNQIISGAGLIDNGSVGTAFSREFHDMTIVLDTPVVLTAGNTYWIEFRTGAPDNYFQESTNTGAPLGSQMWVNYSDLGGLQPGVNIFGVTADIVFSLCSTDATNEPPVVTCPVDIVVDNDPGVCGAIVTFPDATAVDPEDGPIPVVQTAGPASGDLFPVGTTVVEFSATDSAGNTATCTFNVTVNDIEAPEIVCVGEPSDSELLTNGSFESGDFTGWTVEDFDNPYIPYTVDTFISGTGFFPDAFPTDGNFLAGNGFDGEGPDEAILYQDVAIPAGASATLSWDENIDYNLLDFCGGCSDRIFEVQVRDLNGNILEVVHEIIATAGTIDDDNAWASQSVDISAYAGQTVRIAFWQLIPDPFSGPAKFALDKISLLAAVAVNPYIVELDENGQATISASELVLSVNEACGYTVTTVGGSPTPSSLTTLFASNNGGATGGAVYFDVTIGPEDISIMDIDINTGEGGAFTMDVYTVPNTYVGNEGNAGAWTLQTSSSGTGNGTDVPSNAVLDTPLLLEAGISYGIALVLDANHGHDYTNGDGSNQDYANADLSLSAGAASNVPFDGSPFSPRVFNGTLNYLIGGVAQSEITFDCSDLGISTIEIQVTDDSGNQDFCTATVEVVDLISPILVCQDATIVLDEDGMSEVDPEIFLAIAPVNYEVMVIGSDNQSGSEGFTDFTVDITEAAVVSFDWDYVTNDAPGWDSFGYLLNGVYTQLTNPAVGDQSGSANVNVNPGDVFGFRSQTDDNIFGNNETHITNFVPGFEGQFAPENWNLTLSNSNGDAYFIEIPGGPLSYDNCGITVLAVDVTDVTCDDIGQTITVTVFASDASGNLASCTAQLTVVDETGPVIENCPEDITVDPGPLNLFYELPDYWALGEVTATDNCTDPVTVLGQDPAPGTLLPDGTYNIVLTAEDEYGNLSGCTFQLTVESVLGLDDNNLDKAVGLYPNPAINTVNIANASGIILEDVRVYDMNGRLIQNVELDNASTVNTIDVSNLASGIYMVQINGENNAQTVKRLVKE